jgi:hypothetical protein
MKKTNRKKINFLKLIPEKNIDYREEEEGKITLILEKTKNPLLKSIINFFRKSQYFYIHLDKTGSFVWKQIDGKTDNKEILNRMNEVLGDDNSYIDRLRLFLRELEKSKFIRYKNIDNPEIFYDT